MRLKKSPTLNEISTPLISQAAIGGVGHASMGRMSDAFPPIGRTNGACSESPTDEALAERKRRVDPDLVVRDSCGGKKTDGY